MTPEEETIESTETTEEVEPEEGERYAGGEIPQAPSPEQDEA